MKWIGQHIWGLISRFRNDVYLEDISTGTIASGGNLGLDSNNKIVKATEALSNTIHVDAPKYVTLYLFYMNTADYWYTPPLYTTHITTSATINGASISAAYQARGANYIATRACKIKKVTMVFYQASSTLSGDIDLEWALVKWTPADDTANTVTLTQMTMTDNDGAYTETDVHTLTFDVTDNAASTLAEKDCIAFCGRTTSGTGSIRNLVNGHLTYEIELT